MGKTEYYILAFILIIGVNVHASDVSTEIVTQTVYGFLDFVTTIGNTVIVFSPQSAPPLDLNQNTIEATKVIETKPINTRPKRLDIDINPTKLVIINSTNSEKRVAEKKKTHTIEASKLEHSTKQQKPKIENSGIYIESNLNQPEYDLLSRQPTEYIEETYRLVNLNPSSRAHFRNRNTKKSTEDDSAADNHVPSKSSVHSYKNINVKTSSSLTPRILKTAAPLAAKSHKAEADQAVSSSSNTIQRPTGSSKRFNNKNSNAQVSTNVETSNSRSRGTSKKSNRNKSKRRNKHSRTSSSQPSSQSTVKITASVVAENPGRRSFKPKVVPTPTETDGSTSLYMFKLNRTPGRWQYKTSPKPKINIRRPVGDVDHTAAYFNMTSSVNNNLGQGTNLDNVDLESSGSQNGPVLNNANSEENRKYLVETLNVEISTPPDFKDKYYEIATIKTPYTFQAGVVKKTRFITVTSTFEKTLEPEPTATEMFMGPLTENILAPSTTKMDRLLLDGSITTLSPIYLTEGQETPSLEVVTESQSFTQTKYGTQILPIVHNENSTEYVTAIQTYDIKNVITVTKTLLLQEESNFIPSISLKDFNINLDTAGSEINLDLDFADEDNSEYGGEYSGRHAENNATTKPFEQSSSLNPKQLQQLALLNLFNPSIQQQNPTVITTTHPVVKQQTVWESLVVPIVNGQSTIYRTLSKSKGVIDETEYEVNTVTLASAIPPQLSINPFLLPQQQQPQFHTITSPIVHQQLVTETNSKVLKLTFGAKTAYTTLFSTNVVPKIVTTFVTSSIPVLPTANFPGYFPNYQPFPFVG